MPFTLFSGEAQDTIGQCLDKGWAIHILCAAGHSARWNVARLAEDFDRDITLREIAGRLVCKACGSRDGELHLRQDRVVTQARDVAAYEAGKGRRS